MESSFVNCGNGRLSLIYNELLEYSKVLNEIQKKELRNTLSFAELSALNPTYLAIVNQVNERHTALSFATDLPIYLECSSKKNAPTVMVCAMDALPPVPNEENLSKHIAYKNRNKGSLLKQVGFWAPFSLIDNNTDANAEFFSEILKHYNIYVTDIFKLFFYIEKNKKDKKGNTVFSKSNALKTYRGLPAHAEILQKEIKIISPSVILTLGNNAGNALLNLYDKKLNIWSENTSFGGLQINTIQPSIEKEEMLNVISIPHISGAANASKSLILKNKHWENIPGQHIVKYANIVIEALNQFILH